VERLLKVQEAAERLQVSRAFLYELMASGQVDSVSIGAARRVPESSLDAYIKRLVQEHRDRTTSAPIASHG
jgi:excisionase family DNA binding protein